MQIRTIRSITCFSASSHLFDVWMRCTRPHRSRIDHVPPRKKRTKSDKKKSRDLLAKLHCSTHGHVAIVSMLLYSLLSILSLFWRVVRVKQRCQALFTKVHPVHWRRRALPCCAGIRVFVWRCLHHSHLQSVEIDDSCTYCPIERGASSTEFQAI